MDGTHLVSRTSQSTTVGFHFFLRRLLFFLLRTQAEANFPGFFLIQWLDFFFFSSPPFMESSALQLPHLFAFLFRPPHGTGPSPSLSSLHGPYPSLIRAETDTPTPPACCGATHHFRLCFSIPSSFPAAELIWFLFYPISLRSRKDSTSALS